MLSEYIKNALLNTRINHYLLPKEIDLLLKYADIEVFPEGYSIIEQGKKSKGIYILIEGSVIVCSKLLGEGEVCLTRLHCGNYFGEISVIAEQPCVASFICDEKVKCIFIKKNYFDNLKLFFPKIKYQISKAICDDMNSRYQGLLNGIIKILDNNKIIKQSILTEVKRSLIKPTQIQIANTNFKFDQIKNSENFEAFTDKELTTLLDHWICLDAPKYCTLVHEKDVNSGCYLVLQGAVQASIIYEKKLAKIAVLGPLKFFSPLSVVEPEAPSPIDYTTCERAILLYMPLKNFTFLQEKDQLTIWYKFFDLVCATFACLERATNELDLRLRSEFYNRNPNNSE